MPDRARHDREGVEPGRGVDADSPNEVPPAGWKDVAKRVKAEMRDDHSSLSAAGVAYFVFLSMVPALAALVSVYGLFASPSQVRHRVQQAFTALPSDARKLLTSQLSNLVGSSSTALGVGFLVALVLALWSASSGVLHLMEAIGVAYDEEERRGFVRRRGLALAFTLAGLVVGIGMITAITTLPDAVDATALRWILRIAVYVVAALVALAGLAALYRVAPDRDDPRWRWVTPGSIVAIAALVAVSVGLQIYVSNFGNYNATYGALAAVVLLMLWLYLSSLVVIAGAQLNAELEHQTAKDTTEGPSRPLGSRDAEMADTVAPQPS
jgi:membrane protein